MYRNKDKYSNIKVSIIIPVYNVEECVDKCIESVVNQTHSNIEIILINDGSKDKSADKCEMWARNDSRIRFVSKKNEGLGPTRNLGVEMAESAYIMFVDSDDWVDYTIVEKLLTSIIDSDSDISVCDRFEVKLADESKNIVTNDFDEKIIEPSVHKEAIYQVTASQWAKLFKKDLYTHYDIKQPAHYYEDAVTAILVALSNRVVYVNEPLYYYVIDRAGSITNDISTMSHLVEYLKTVIDLFIRYSLFDKFNKELFVLCDKRINWNLYRAEKLLQWSYDRIRYENISLLNRYWDLNEISEVRNWSHVLRREQRFFIWGSYNLMTSMKMLMQMNGPEFPKKHFCFSSFISAVEYDDGYMNKYSVNHENEFRKYHLLREMKRDFIHSNPGEYSDVDYVVIDLMEERFDIGVLHEHYFTISDAFQNSEMHFEESYIISRKDPRLSIIWEESCLKYIEYLNVFFPAAEIVLVKNKLSEKYGSTEETVLFKNIDEIREINNMLDNYYRFFERNCPRLIVVDPTDSDLYYTDENYRHGCFPWHLNYYVYKEIAGKIVDKIWKKKK